MLRQKIYERASYRTYAATPKKSDYKNENSYLISEWRLALFGLILSLIILASKIYYSNRVYIHNVLYDRNLVSLETVTESGQVMFVYAWKESLKYSKYWLPALCGLLTTYFTWIMVYLDSNVPGIQPPSPLSPTKYKIQSGHSFHLNYVFALLVGVLASCFMYWKEVSLS